MWNSGKSNRVAYQRAPLQRQEGCLPSRTAATGQVPVPRIQRAAVEIAVCLEVQHSLWLRGASEYDSSGGFETTIEAAWRALQSITPSNVSEIVGLAIEPNLLFY